MAERLAALDEALRVAFASIAEYARTDPVPGPPTGEAADTARIAALLSGMKAAFATSEPALMAPLLADLDRLLPTRRLGLVHEAYLNFDFIAGEEAIAALAAELNVQLEA